MKTDPECIPCILNQTIRAVKFSKNEHMLEKVLKNTLQTLLETNWNNPPMALGFETFKTIRLTLGINDPYREEKKRVNNFAQKLLSQIEEIARKSRDKVDTAIKIAIAGNIIDYGSQSGFDVKKTITQVLHTKPAIYDIDILKEKLRNANRVMIFLDNAGEVVFDRYMLETFKEAYGIRNFTVVARKEPMINDIIVEELDELGFKTLGDIDYRAMPSSSIREWKRFLPELKKWIKEADIVISKGQGNFELMEGLKGIFFMFMIKCDVVAKIVGAKKGSIILKFSGTS